MTCRSLCCLLSVVSVAIGETSPHPVCAAMATYQASYVATDYDYRKHMGHFYELAFRDLYPAPPLSDCQHTNKTLDSYLNGSVVYHEDFVLDVGGVPYSNTIVLTQVSASQLAVYNQTITKSKPPAPIPGINSVVFNTATIAFKALLNQLQYEWVIEFTCGATPNKFIDALFPGGFVGINFYSRSGPVSPSNLQEMKEAVAALGLGWAIDSWGVGFHEVPFKNCTFNRIH